MTTGINRKQRQKAHQVQGLRIFWSECFKTIDSRRKNWRYFKSKWKAGNDSQPAVTIAGTERGSKAWPIITISFSTFTIPGLLPFTFCKYLGFVYDTSTFPLPRALEKYAAKSAENCKSASNGTCPGGTRNKSCDQNKKNMSPNHHRGSLQQRKQWDEWHNPLQNDFTAQPPWN